MIKQFIKNFIPKRLHSIIRILFYKIKGTLIFSRYFCPFCKIKLLKFNTYGIIPRPNAQCPSCGSLERHRFLWLYLKNRTDFFNKRIKLLDIAPLPFFKKMAKRLPNINYISIDLISPFADIKSDITALALKPDLFDVIICYHVLEHIQDDISAMKNLFSVLKPGGWAILQVPINTNREKTYEDFSITSFEEREKAFGQGDHVRRYGLDYKNRLTSVGFIVKPDSYIKELSEKEITKFGLNSNEIIYYCIKPG